MLLTRCLAPCGIRGRSAAKALKRADNGRLRLICLHHLLRGQGARPGSASSAGDPARDHPGYLDWLVEQSLTVSRLHAAERIFDVATHDWRSLIPHIRLPTLVIAGDSVKRADCLTAVDQLGLSWSPLRTGGRHGGTHFPFLQNRSAFDAALSSSAGAHSRPAPRVVSLHPVARGCLRPDGAACRATTESKRESIRSGRREWSPIYLAHRRFRLACSLVTTITGSLSRRPVTLCGILSHTSWMPWPPTASGRDY